MLKIVFFGLPLAGWLLAEDAHDVRLAVLSPVGQSPGRRRLGRRLGRSQVIAECTPAREVLVDERLASERFDLLVSWFWTRRLPERWLAVPRLGAIGAHPSLLPRHRGPDPYFWAIDSGDVQTGVTVHELTAGYDEGAVLAQAVLPIGELNAWQLARALDRPSLRLLRQVVADFARGARPKGAAQNDALSSAAPCPTADLLRVDWSWPTERVLRRIRALTPEPGLALDIAGVKIFVVQARASAIWPQALLPGEAAALSEPDVAVVIRTGDGAVAIERAVAGWADPDAAPALTPGVPLEPSELARLVRSARWSGSR
jgi:methionyl-tRNA formyltransferase